MFNIGNQNSIHLKTFINIIEKKMKIKAKKRFIKKQPGDLTLTKSLVSREKRIFAHETKTDLNYGIEKLINWYNNYFK